MGYTPESENLQQEVHAVIEAIQPLCEKLKTRALRNEGDWNNGHRTACLELRSRLEHLCLELSMY